MLPRLPQPPRAHALHPELRLYSLYRLLTASLLLALLFAPQWLGNWQPRSLPLALGVLGSYWGIAALLLAASFASWRPQTQMIAGVLVDIAFANGAMVILPPAVGVVGVLLMFNVAAAGMLVSPMFGVFAGVLASGSMLLRGLGLDDAFSGDMPHMQHLLYALAYLTIALLASRVGRRLRRSEQLAEEQRLAIAELSALNEQVLTRLPVGVVVVNREGRIRTRNEAARELLAIGDDIAPAATLAAASPKLDQRLRDWLPGQTHDARTLLIGQPPRRIQPRFLRLHPQGDEVLVFLEDTSQSSRRAETLALAALGRFSASMAHEIRNPLSAIHHAAQLLDESPQLDPLDRRMLAIIRQQVQRTNGIIESVLGLARRQPSHPQPFDLARLVRELADEYRASFPLDDDSLETITPDAPIPAHADPQQVHQILMVLVSNARYYGRQPGQPAHMRLQVHGDGEGACVDVADGGPGIAPEARPQLFQPFHTTSEHGTGLGLYIARELAEANHGQLEYLPQPVGACFRLRLPAAPAARPQGAGHTIGVPPAPEPPE